MYHQLQFSFENFCGATSSRCCLICYPKMLSVSHAAFNLGFFSRTASLRQIISRHLGNLAHPAPCHLCLSSGTFNFNLASERRTRSQMASINQHGGFRYKAYVFIDCIPYLLWCSSLVKNKLCSKFLSGIKKFDPFHYTKYPQIIQQTLTIRFEVEEREYLDRRPLPRFIIFSLINAFVSI